MPGENAIKMAYPSCIKSVQESYGPIQKVKIMGWQKMSGGFSSTELFLGENNANKKHDEDGLS